MRDKLECVHAVCLHIMYFKFVIKKNNNKNELNYKRTQSMQTNFEKKKNRIINGWIFIKFKLNMRDIN